MNVPGKAGTKAEDGAAVLEMALVLSILLVLLMGIVQFGLAYHSYQRVQVASHEGGRLAALPESTVAEIRDRVRVVGDIDPAQVVSACPPAVPGQYCIEVEPPLQDPPCADRGGELVTVRVQRWTRVDIPMWASPEFPLTGQGVFRCE